MSSAEDEFNDEGTIASGSAQGSKKRRVQRACDVCRRKKIRCDGGQMPSNKCSNCILCSSECTYVEAAKKRGSSKGYVADLENRLQKMEKLLSKLAPNGDFIQERNDQLQPTNTIPPVELPAPMKTSSYSQFPKIKTNNMEDNGLAPIDEVVANMEQLRLDPVQQRFFGKSSGLMLLHAAINMKNEYTRKENQSKDVIMPSKRPEFWTVYPWEIADVKVDISTCDFPDDGLMAELIDLYFNHVNIWIPILHRPTLDKGIADGLHWRDPGFGETVLLVCAVGSRHSNDPRVFLPNVGSEISAGWKWFDQVHTARKPMLTPPCLYDLQVQYLSVLYLQGSSAPQRCWSMIGVGIRLAQEVGAHRRKTDTSALTVEDELWKRAFWALVIFDRFLSSSFGRPCATQDEDFDIDLPAECDDEYWEHSDPERAFKQPLNKPSKVSFFISVLKLNQILAFALRTVYATNKAKVMLGFIGHKWDQQIVAELDSALNKWIDEVPDHLRWDPNREDETFFNQSACLHAWYYHLQILVHRPFIPFPRQPSPLSFPSLAICTNAARSCSHIIDIQQRRTGGPLHHMHIPLFTACIVLLVNIWGGKQSGLSTSVNKDLEDVQKCMVTLKINEKRWHTAGRLWDIFHDLANAGLPPLPQSNLLRLPYKRERNSDSPRTGSSVTASSASSPQPAEEARDITELQRSTDNSLSLAPNPATAFQFSSLPMHSDEPSRLPMRGRAELLSHGNERIDTTDQSWLSAFGDTSTIPGHPLVANSSQGDNGLDTSSTMAPPDPLFYGHVGNEFSSSSSQPLDRGQGQSYGLYPTDVNPDQQFQHHYPQAMIDSNTIEMWNHAPTGFELEDWDSYVNELSLGQPHAAYGQGF